MTEQTLAKGTEEYALLEAVAGMLTAFSKNHRQYIVKDKYFDYGQEWWWTTICYDGGWTGVQALTPRDWKALMGCATPHEVANVVNDIRTYLND